MERQRERRQDPAFKEKANAQRRARRNDPAFKEKANARQRARRQERQQEDPAFKEKVNAQQRARRSDPAVKEKTNAQRRLSRERRRQEEAAAFSAAVPSPEAAEQRPKADAACETWDLERGDDHQVLFILSLDPFLPYVRAHSSHISP